MESGERVRGKQKDEIKQEVEAGRNKPKEAVARESCPDLPTADASLRADRHC